MTRKIVLVSAAALTLGLVSSGCGSHSADECQATNKKLQAEIDTLNAKIAARKTQLKATGAAILPFLDTVYFLSTDEMKRESADLAKPIYTAFPVADMIATEAARAARPDSVAKYPNSGYPGFATNYTGQVALTDYRVLLAGIVRKVLSAARTAAQEAKPVSEEAKEVQDDYQTPRDLVKWMESIDLNLRRFSQDALIPATKLITGNAHKRSVNTYTLVHDLGVMEDLLKVVKAMEIVDAMKALSKSAKPDAKPEDASPKLSEEKLAEAISLKATVAEDKWLEATVVTTAAPYFKAVQKYVISYVDAVLAGKDDATLEANLSAVKAAYVKCLYVKPLSVLIAKAPAPVP